MMLGWFNAREATEVGTALADHFTTRTLTEPPVQKGKASAREQSKAWQDFLQKADRAIGSLRLNFYKKAKFANSFKWRLLEKGIERALADELTHTLLMRISRQTAAGPLGQPESQTSDGSPYSKLKDLLAEGDRSLNEGDFAQAVTHYEDLLRLKPNHADAHQNLGAALFKLARYADAEVHLRQAVKLKPKDARPLRDLGDVLRIAGRFPDAQDALRRSLKLDPSDSFARSGLGTVLMLNGDLTGARAQFEKALKLAPRNPNALVGLAQVAAMEGDSAGSEALFQRVLEIVPNMPTALSAIAKLRKMTPADQDWLARAKEAVTSAPDPLEQANLQFALGKYHDDVHDFDGAFEHFQRGNELMKTMARPYNRAGHESFVDDLIRVYTPETVAQIGAGASDSKLPVLVVGMPRSGTSLLEQIIASHPKASGAGELTFWTGLVREHAGRMRQGLPSEAVRHEAAAAYLRLLKAHSSAALRIVDKAPANTEYLGIIHSVFPKARIIHMRRDPIDTCLSCYFQHFSSALSFSFDLGDLAHYYRQFHRMMAHWNRVLPAGTILEVPYEELVADQEKWTRRVLEFLELEWDARCLNFQDTKRAVATASTWQVRQKMHQGSVQRSRKYRKHIGALRELEKLEA